MSHETPGGEWKWRVILERAGQYEEVLVKQLQINVPSYSQEDEMPVVGRKYHIACYVIQKSKPTVECCSCLNCPPA